MIIQSQEITTPQYKFFRVAVFLLFINAMYPWPLWEVKLPIAAIIAFIASLYIFLDKKHYIKGERGSKIILIAYLLLALWFYRNFTIWGILGHAIAAFPTIMIFFLKKEYKYDLINFVSKWFAIILSISLSFYVLYIVGLPLPHVPFTFPDYSYSHEIYYFFVTNPMSSRFNSIFLEPGHMTMGLAPLLYVNRYDFKNKYVLILLVAQLFSLSLAGIILLIVGLLFQAMSSNSLKSGISKILIMLAFLSAAVYGITQVIGDEIIQSAIIDRVATGENAIEKRTDEYTSNLFDRFMKSDSMWIGMPEIKDKLDGAGYKVFLLTYGFIGLALVIFMYSIPVIVYKNREILFFFVFMFMLFFQDAYPDWFCALFSYIVGSSYLYYTRRLIAKKKKVNFKVRVRNEKDIIYTSN